MGKHFSEEINKIIEYFYKFSFFLGATSNLLNIIMSNLIFSIPSIDALVNYSSVESHITAVKASLIILHE